MCGLGLDSGQNAVRCSAAMSTTTGLSLTELREELDKYKDRLGRVRNIADEKAKRVRSLGIKFGAAFLAGKYESDQQRRGQQTFSLMGLNFTESVAAAGLVVGEFASGEAAELGKDIGESMLCVSGYRAGQRSAQR